MIKTYIYLLTKRTPLSDENVCVYVEKCTFKYDKNPCVKTYNLSVVVFSNSSETTPKNGLL